MALKDKYFTISEAATMAGVTRQTISRWVATGQIRAEKVGRNTLIPRRALLRYTREKPMGELREIVSKEIVNHADLLLGVGENDRVEVVGHPSELRFLVTKENGSSEEIEIEDFTLTMDNTLRSLSYRQSKRREGGR
jgi:excisionase family DNA binding protein